MHPGVQFNDSRIGHGVSLVQNHKMHGGRARVSEWECSQHYTVINLRRLCAYGPELLPFEMRDSIFIPGQNESCGKGGRGRQMGACGGGNTSK